MTEQERRQEARKKMRQGQYEEAAPLFEQNTQVPPHFKALELLGEYFIRVGRLSEVIVPLATDTTLNRGAKAPSLLAECSYELSTNTMPDKPQKRR